ncbi:type II secretion system protein N [Bordetella sp. 2513F-2]
MTRLARLAAVLLACFVAAAAALAVLPARWLLRLQPDNALLTLVDADGTLWNGRGWLALGAPGQRRMLTEPLSWQWRGGGLEVRHAWMRAPVKITPGWRGAAVSAGQAQLPAGALYGLGTPWNTIAPGGQLALQWQRYDPAAAATGTVAEATWREASSAISPVAPLGDYRLRLTRADDGLHLSLETLRGALRLAGEGAMRNGHFRFQGEAAASDQASDAQRAGLQGLLYALGPSRDGVHRYGVKD